MELRKCPFENVPLIAFLIENILLVALGTVEIVFFETSETTHLSNQGILLCCVGALYLAVGLVWCTLCGSKTYCTKAGCIISWILMTLFICWLPIYQLFQIPAVGMDSESYDITGSNTRQHEDTSEVTLGIPVRDGTYAVYTLAIMYLIMIVIHFILYLVTAKTTSVRGSERKQPKVSEMETLNV